MRRFDVTLTFDNGPDPETTPQVLSVLARRGIKATFFVIGSKLADREAFATAERAHAEGHWIGNHTFTHSIPFGIGLDPAAPEAEIGATQRALKGLAHPASLFRPYGGGVLGKTLLSRPALNYLLSNHYSCVLWNSVPRDWAEPDQWVETAFDHLARQPWTLMVLHDLPTGAMKHLDRFLDEAEARGAHFRQDFPPDCVPIAGGAIRRQVEDYLTESQAGAHDRDGA
ncbi:polysaccharide deacetylase family protein [Pseudochelatococcus sp. B33]